MQLTFVGIWVGEFVGMVVGASVGIPAKCTCRVRNPSNERHPILVFACIACHILAGIYTFEQV